MKEENKNSTQNIEKFFKTDNNYIEYFFEVGIKPDIFNDKEITPEITLEKLNSKLKPKLICKFPYFDKESISIDSSVIDFVFPKDFKAITSTKKPDCEFYSIMLDKSFNNNDTNYKYIGCLVIYEAFNSYKKLYDSYIEDDFYEKDNNKAKEEFKNIYIPKALCLVSFYPNINKFELILRCIYELVSKGKNYFIDDIIERLICQTPKVPRGIKNIFLKILDKNINLSETKLNELITVNVNLKNIFSLFKIEKIVDIFKLMLYETKMIVFSSKKEDITNFILSFIILLKPFTYQYRILSILPKIYYYFLEDNNPCIFGVNEIYSTNFFADNNLFLGNDCLICIVDLDKKDYYLINKHIKNIPAIPDRLKVKLDKRTEEYRKNSKKTGDRNEDYQEIFYRFMYNLLKDCPKHLTKNFSGSNKLQDMFDKQGFINNLKNREKEFYEQIINSKMFLDFIEKRFMPKNTQEKIEILFFNEKLNVKHAQSKIKILGANKILEQNVLLPSKDFDFGKEPEIIDLIGKSPFTILDKETIKFFDKEKINKEICMPRGYMVSEGKSKNELYFYYYIFPELLSEKLFKYNCNNYYIPQNYNLSILKKSEDIIRLSSIRFEDNLKNKSGELLNDVYISYLILFSLSLSYMDKEERKPRFNNLLQILSKIDKPDMKVIELLFNFLIKLNEEELAAQLYTLLNQMHINLTWGIFFNMANIFHKGQKMYANISKDLKYSLISRNMQNIKFRKRSIKLTGVDDYILGEEIFFDVFGACLNCNNNINLERICEELSPMDIDKNNNRFKCRCGDWNLQKLNFKIGTELYNPNITNNHSSRKEGVILLSPTNLKKKLMGILISLKDKKFDIDNFRAKYPEEFWNSVWYFKLKEIDISFMLPYLKSVYIKKIEIKNNIKNCLKFVLEQEKNSKPFKFNNDETKSPNIKIIKVPKIVNKFNTDILSIQKVYQIAIFQIVGMLIYKPTEPYRGNIAIKGNIMKVTYKKKKIEKKNDKKLKNKNKDNILFFNNFITSDFDLTNSISTNYIDKNEESNNKLKERKSYIDFENKPKEEIFEYINEDDENFYKFKEYKEVDIDNL